MTVGRFAGEGFPLTPAREPTLAAPAAPPKPAAPGPFSRFTVSPAPASRFSITHVSDSDAGSVGGEAAAGLAGGDPNRDNEGADRRGTHWVSGPCVDFVQAIFRRGN